MISEAPPGDTKAPTDIAGILLAENEITEEQLKRARRVQSKLEAPRRLSEVLVSLGYAAETRIRELMRKYKQGLRMGDFLVEMGLINETDLQRALSMQTQHKKRLGEMLIEMGALNEWDLSRALAEKMDCPLIEPDLRMADKRLLLQASERFLQKHQMLPFAQSEEGIVMIMADPSNAEALSEARQVYSRDIIPAVAPREGIIQALDGLARLRATELIVESSREGQGVIRMVDEIINAALEDGVSDIHVEPQAKKTRIRFRRDGVLQHRTDIPKNLQDAFLSRLKVMAGCDIANKRRHQDGRIQHEWFGQQVDIRVSTYVSVFGETIVMRLLNERKSLKTLSDLGMSKRLLARYTEEVLEPASGVVIITGPTGSGKTTTLYGSLDYINDPSLKMITAEDPVEYVIDGVVQCSVKPEIGLTFEDTLRAIVRQDPDVIVLGEIRDKATAAVAIQAALTGHKVFSTFHTEDSIGGIIRLIDMDIETFLISSTVLSVVAQRLVRCICNGCKEKYVPSAVEVRRAYMNSEEAAKYSFYRGRGCSQCRYTGYTGRVGLYEVLVLNEELRGAVLEKKTAYDIRRIGIEETGLTTLLEDGLVKCINGITTLDELRRTVPFTHKPRSLEVIQRLTEGQP